MCQFQSLSFNDDGYIIRCSECKYYQVAFGSTLLTLSAHDFIAFCKTVKYKCNEEDYALTEHTKSVIIPTPYFGLSMFLSRDETRRFCEILEEADNEASALSLIGLFNE